MKGRGVEIEGKEKKKIKMFRLKVKEIERVRNTRGEIAGERVRDRASNLNSVARICSE